MSFDLALSPNGDLIFSGSRDLQGVSGTALIEQRIRLRLRMNRGQWQYDPEGKLGSQLYTLSGQSIEIAEGHAQLFVREALRDMDDIVVDDVQILEGEDHALEIYVKYHLANDDGSLSPGLVLDLTVAVPVGG